MFEVVAGSNTITPLVSFNGTDGESPLRGSSATVAGIFSEQQARAVQRGRNAFVIAAGVNTVITLVTFNGTNGNSPAAALVTDGKGNFYGTTTFGGADNYGVVFKLTLDLKLAFVSQPSNAVAGVTIPTVTVDVEDDNGNLMSTDNSDVTLGISSGTLSGTLTEQAVNGVATFSNLSSTTAGTHTLTASDSEDNLSGFASSSFTISPAAPSQLVFTTGPAGGVAGKTLAAVKVKIEDGYGNVETGDSSTSVRLTDGGATLGGTISVTASDGVATFKSLSITEAGADILYAADSADSLSGFASNSFTISPAAPSQLVFATQPGDVLAGNTISAVVSLEDAYGNVVTTANSIVTVALDAGTLNGTLAERAVNGAAAFSGLSVPAASAGMHTLTATDGSLTPATSSDFSVTAVGLAGTWQLAGVLSNGSFTTDSHGGVVSGSVLSNGSTTPLSLTGGSYAVTGNGTFTMTCEDASGWAYTWAGSVNAAHDVVTLTQTPLQDITNQAVMVLNTGTFSDASLSGTWAFQNADGTSGSLTFDGKGDVTAGNLVSETNGASGTFLKGSKYSVSTGGLVTVTLYLPNKSSPGGQETIVWSGALNASDDLFAGNEAVSADLNHPTLVTMTKHAGTFALSDLDGTLNLTGDGMAGTVVFNGVGKITGGSYSTASGTVSITGGTYTVSGTGLVTLNATESGNAKVQWTGYLDSAMDALAMDQVVKGGKTDQEFLSVLTAASATDLVDKFAGGTLLNLNPAIPGDKGTVKVMVTDDGQIPAGGQRDHRSESVRFERSGRRATGRAADEAEDQPRLRPIGDIHVLERAITGKSSGRNLQPENGRHADADQPGGDPGGLLFLPVCATDGGLGVRDAGNREQRAEERRFEPDPGGRDGCNICALGRRDGRRDGLGGRTGPGRDRHGDNLGADDHHDQG